MTSANNKRKEMSEPPVAEEKPQWALDLLENGYCVIENVMLASECDAVERDLLGYFANMGVDLKDYNSMNKAQPMHSIVQHHECGHSNAVWQVRLNSRVQDIFAQIHGTNDLLCSFDGLSYMPENLPKVDRTKSWFHMDQSFRRAPLQCVQSYVNITDASDAKTGSLCVIPGSHKFFAEFFEAFPEMRDNDDWCKIDPGPHATGAHERWFEEKTGNKATRVHGGKGSMVL
jgi:ectoine hydroxylase-related dioxygenase (phytanoyl-CoA dioxygenase family)